MQFKNTSDTALQTDTNQQHAGGELHAKLPRQKWRAPEGPAAVPVGGGAWPGFEATHRAEGSRRGRLAGGPPPTDTHSGRARRRPEHQRRHKQRKRAAARQGRRAFTQLVRKSTQSRAGALDTVETSRTQRSRAATTSATWTALRAAPLRRLSPETTRTRPRLPSTA